MDDKIKSSDEPPKQMDGQDLAVNSPGTESVPDKKTSERRRSLLKAGIVSVPTVITLHSGPAAASSCVSCDPSAYDNMGAATTDIQSLSTDNTELYLNTNEPKKDKVKKEKKNQPKNNRYY